MLPPALILGRGETMLGVLRVLARAGVRAFVLGARGTFGAWSRYYRTLPGAAADEPAESDLASFLEEAPLDEAVLMPCSDAWVTAVSRLDALRSARYHASISPPAIVEMFVDKRRFAETLERLALPRPNTVSIETLGDLERVSDREIREGFLKPCRSQDFARRFGVKAFRCQDRSSARRLCQQAMEEGHRLTLQEFIPGPPTSHYFLDGFVDRRGRLSALFARRRLRMTPPDFGNSTCMISIPLEEDRPAVTDVTRLVSEIGYRGVFSVELKRDARDGLYKLLEVNARPWWYVAFAASCGVDVSLMAYRDALGLDVETVTRYAVGRRCVHLRNDVRAAKRLIRAGELRFGPWLRSVWGAEDAVFDWRDPGPALASAWQSLRRRHSGPDRAPATREPAP